LYFIFQRMGEKGIEREEREKEMICIRYVSIFYEPNRCSTDGRIRSPPPRGPFVFVFFVLSLYFLFLYPRHEKFDCWLRSSSSSWCTLRYYATQWHAITQQRSTDRLLLLLPLLIFCDSFSIYSRRFFFFYSLFDV